MEIAIAETITSRFDISEDELSVNTSILELGVSLIEPLRLKQQRHKRDRMDLSIATLRTQQLSARLLDACKALKSDFSLTLS